MVVIFVIKLFLKLSINEIILIHANFQKKFAIKRNVLIAEKTGIHKEERRTYLTNPMFST
jgi:hypothetical protein